MAKRDQYTRDWIIQNSIEITRRYNYGELTIRALHYQLVAIGMTNTIQHYKRVVAAMIKARVDVERIEAFINIKRKDPVEYIEPWEQVRKNAIKTLKRNTNG